MIKIFEPNWESKVGDIQIKNDSAVWCAGDKDPPVADKGTQQNRTNAALKSGERTGTMTMLASPSFGEARGGKSSCSSSRIGENEQHKRPRIRNKPDHKPAVYGG